MRELFIIHEKNKAMSLDKIKQYFDNLEPYNESEGDHIKKLASYVFTKEEGFDKALKNLLVGIVEAVDKEIRYHKGLFLVGPQDVGKSCFLRFLCPPELEECYQLGFDLEEPNYFLALTNSFIIELDEIGHYTIEEWTELQVLSSGVAIEYRDIETNELTEIKRIASFVGSTNLHSLISPIKEHFHVFTVKDIKHEYGDGYDKDIDIDRVYAQALHLYRNQHFLEELYLSEN